MVVEQKKWTPQQGWTSVKDGTIGDKAQLVLAFGNKDLVADKSMFSELKKEYPKAELVLTAADGAFLNDEICDECVVASAYYFEKTKIQAIQVNLKDVKDSFDAGMHISASLDKDELCSLLIFSDGSFVNSSHLITGIHFNLSEIVPVTGGLASCNDCQEGAICGLNQIPTQGNIIGIALHGEYLKVGHACKSGWTAFGQERIITQAMDNEIFGIDDTSIIEIYKRYVDDDMSDEQGKVRYPIGIKYADSEDRIIRGIIDIDEESEKMSFGGEIPVNSKVRLMKSNKFSLIDSAAAAAKSSMVNFDISRPDFALIASNQSRRYILGDWAVNELNAAREVMGDGIPTIGYYSKAEISPMGPLLKGELHNQSLMITTFKEI